MRNCLLGKKTALGEQGEWRKERRKGKKRNGREINRSSLKHGRR